MNLQRTLANPTAQQAAAALIHSTLRLYSTERWHRNETQVAVNTFHVHASAGFVSLPLPWNQQLVSILRAKDKLVLFMTCSFWAQQVVHHTSRSTLRIGEKYSEEPSPPAAKVDAQRIIITRLLIDSRDINIVILGPDNLPFPSTLCARVSAIKMEFGVGSRARLPPLPWDALTNLQYLGVGNKVTATLVAKLCKKLQAGHMPQLSKLKVHVESGHELKVEMIKLAKAAGPRLLHLTTNSTQLLQHLACFTALQSAEFQWEGLSAYALRQLCLHPSLRHITLKQCEWIESQGNGSQLHCSWKSLTLVSCRPWVINELPFTGVKQIRIVDAIHDSTERYNVLDRFYLEGVVESRRPKIVCEASGDTFSLCDVQPESIALVRRMRAVERLHLEAVRDDSSGSDKSSSGPWSGPYRDMRHKVRMYQAMLGCIHHITLVSVINLKWAQLWQGMPSTVRSVSIFNCNLPVADAIALVQAAPAHITRINLRESYVPAYDSCRVGPCGCVRGNDKRAVQWQAAGLQDMAPAHVTLYLQTPDDDCWARRQAGQVDV